MAYILQIDSSHSVCSVSLAKDGQLFSHKETHEPNAHSRLLSVFVDEMLRENRVEAQELSAVAISQGPGSYTGLRIGASFAKGLCFGLNIPFIAIDTLEAMAHWFSASAQSTIDETDTICPMIDARRMEVYTEILSSSLEIITPATAKIIDDESFKEELSSGKVHFFGNGADKCSSVITNTNAHFHPDFQHSSRGMTSLVWQKYTQKEFSDIAYFEPFYLKDFVATVSKKSIFT